MSKTAIVWTCAHADPSVDNKRFDWLSKLIQDIKPDYTIDLGDGADMRSLNSYDTRNPKAIVTQSYEADIEAYNDSQERLWSPFKRAKKKRPHRIGFQGNHECFQGFTEILTRRGWIKAPEVSTEDEVLTLSGWESVTKTHKYPYEGELVNIGTSGKDFLVTPDHRVYYYTSQKKLKVKPARDLPKDFYVPVSTKVNLQKSDLTDDELRFCAVALTDSYHKDNNLVFYQSGDKAQVIRDLLNRLGINFKEIVRDRQHTHICGVKLKSCQVGYEFHMKRPTWAPDQNKRIPKHFMDISEKQSEVFLDMLIFCDGSTFIDGRSSRTFYGRKEICDDVQAFCNMHGHRASLTEYRQNQWRVNINPRDTLKIVRKKGGHVKDFVYCITVPSGNFLARQNGLSMFTGNCRIQKAIELDPRLEGSKYGISFKHLNTDIHFDEYHKYENGAPAIKEYDGVSYAHYFSSGNFGSAMSGIHHAYGLLQKRNSSATCGHSHKRSIYFKDGAYPKPIIGLVAGCFKGAEEGWAGQANSEWAKGVVIKRNIDRGCYDFQWISMEMLEKEYG